MFTVAKLTNRITHHTRSPAGVIRVFYHSLLRGPVMLLAPATVLVGSLAASVVEATFPLARPPGGYAPNSLLLPPPTQGGRVKVTVALRVLNLSDINEVAERFELTGYLLAQWRDPRLTYLPTGHEQVQDVNSRFGVAAAASDNKCGRAAPQRRVLAAGRARRADVLQ
jgi:hypothetical protein